MNQQYILTDCSNRHQMSPQTTANEQIWILLTIERANATGENDVSDNKALQWVAAAYIGSTSRNVFVAPLDGCQWRQQRPCRRRRDRWWRRRRWRGASSRWSCLTWSRLSCRPHDLQANQCLRQTASKLMPTWHKASLCLPCRNKQIKCKSGTAEWDCFFDYFLT